MTSLAIVEAGIAYPLAAFGRVEVEWDGVIGKADVVDNAVDFPGGNLMFVEQTPKTRIFTVRLVIASASEAACNDSLQQLASLVWSPSAPVLFRRTIPYTAGDETAEAYAYLVNSFRPARPAPNIATLALDFRMLSAYWYDTTTSAAVSL